MSGTQRHKGTKAQTQAAIKRSISAAFLCAFVPLCLCVPSLFAQEHVGQYSQVDVETGFNLYNANCITCHGANGDSVPGVNLRSGQFRRVATDADLNRLIQTGIPGTAMPPGRYLTADLAALIAYIRSLREFDTV